MQCYTCSQQKPGGTELHARIAVAICKSCGVGICEDHCRFVSGKEGKQEAVCPKCSGQEASKRG